MGKESATDTDSPCAPPASHSPSQPPGRQLSLQDSISHSDLHFPSVGGTCVRPCPHGALEGRQGSERVKTGPPSPEPPLLPRPEPTRPEPRAAARALTEARIVPKDGLRRAGGARKPQETGAQAPTSQLQDRFCPRGFISQGTRVRPGIRSTRAQGEGPWAHDGGAAHRSLPAAAAGACVPKDQRRLSSAEAGTYTLRRHLPAGRGGARAHTLRPAAWVRAHANCQRAAAEEAGRRPQTLR